MASLYPSDHTQYLRGVGSILSLMALIYGQLICIISIYSRLVPYYTHIGLLRQADHGASSKESLKINTLSGSTRPMYHRHKLVTRHHLSEFYWEYHYTLMHADHGVSSTIFLLFSSGSTNYSISLTIFSRINKASLAMLLLINGDITESS